MIACPQCGKELPDFSSGTRRDLSGIVCPHCQTHLKLSRGSNLQVVLVGLAAVVAGVLVTRLLGFGPASTGAVAVFAIIAMNSFRNRTILYRARGPLSDLK